MALNVDRSCALAQMSNNKTKQQTDYADETVFQNRIKFTEINKKTSRNDRHKLSSII